MNASRGGFDPRTLAVHVGNEADPATGAVAPPIHLATTFRHGPAGERLAGYEYQREGNPTNDRLREALMALEGGAEALTFASGMAAMTTLLESLPAGARVLFPDDCYSGLRMLFREFLPERGIVAEVADMSDLDAVRAACAKPLAVLWIETPSNPRMKISDIAALAGIGRAAGALVVVDNTFATPLLQRRWRWAPTWRCIRPPSISAATATCSAARWCSRGTTTSRARSRTGYTSPARCWRRSTPGSRCAAAVRSARAWRCIAPTRARSPDSSPRTRRSNA